MLKRLAALTLAAALVGASAAAHAQAGASYPNRTIRVVVPFPPGAFNDTLGRLLAQEFQKTWGQPAIVENKPGAGSAIGADFVAKSPADGYTLLIVAFPFALINSLHTRMGMDVTARLRAGRVVRGDAEHPRRASVGAGEHGRRAGRARAPEAGHAQLRLDRDRLARTTCRWSSSSR